MINPFQDDQIVESEEISSESFEGVSLNGTGRQSNISQSTASLPICFHPSPQQSTLKMRTPICSMAASSPSNLPTPTSYIPSQPQNQLIAYVQSLQARNIEIAMELQRERMKHQQVVAAVTLMRGEQDRQQKDIESKNTKIRQLQIKVRKLEEQAEEKDRSAQSLKAENGYLKQLILIANQNYQSIESKYTGILQSNASLQKQVDSREEELHSKMIQLKELFSKLLSHPVQPAGNQNINTLQGKKQKDQGIGSQNQIPHASCSSGKKKEVEDVYRQMFMKTLKGKKDNK